MNTAKYCTIWDV